jgi:D-aspartate ligase
MADISGRALPPVVVAGAFQTGVVLMRELKRKGVETHCIDCNANKQGFKTIYGKAHLCPNPDTHPAEWQAFMVQLAQRIGGKPVLIASADMFVTAIADHAAALDPYFVLRAEALRTQALLATKERQYEIAGANGLPIPKTSFVESLEDVRRFAAEAMFPCLIKPVHFREWARLPESHPLLNEKVAIVKTVAELEEKYASVAGTTPSVVLQEIIEGADDAKLVYLSCFGRGGKRLGSCVVRQLRADPIFFGSASVVEPIDDPETETMCERFFQSIEYEGLCELELKRDSRDGRVKLIEANPRYSVTADAGPYAGVNLGWLHYLDLIDQAVEPVRWNGRRFHHIVLQRDVECYRSYLDAGLTTWRQLARSYSSPHFFDFDVRDWRLSSEIVVTVAKELLGPLYRRLRPKHN